MHFGVRRCVSVNLVPWEHSFSKFFNAVRFGLTNLYETTHRETFELFGQPDPAKPLTSTLWSRPRSLSRIVGAELCYFKCGGGE